jgi:hypothetical protein
MDIRKIGLRVVEWIQLAEDSDQCEHNDKRSELSSGLYCRVK